jgi:3-phytase
MMLMTRARWAAGRWALATLLSGGIAAAGAAPAPPPAKERVALPGGAWLTLAKQELRLIDAQGAVHARWAVRGESLDARLVEATRGIALVVDRNAERVVPLRFDTEGGTLEALPPLPDPGRSIAASCLYRDAQGLPHAFVIAENGFAQQWLLLHDAAPRLVRAFAVAPDARHCSSADGRDRLFVSEPGGLWLHRAEPEADDTREVVALSRPHGPLQKGGGALTVERNAVTVRDGQRLRRFGLAAPARAALPIVTARVQTAPVAQSGDAADDPAIWMHPTDPVGVAGAGHRQEAGAGGLRSAGAGTAVPARGRINNVDCARLCVWATSAWTSRPPPNATNTASCSLPSAPTAA